MSTAQVLAAKPATCKHALVAIFTDEHRLASCCLKFLPARVLNMCNQDFVPHLHDYAETKSFILLSVTYILNNCFVFLVCLRERWRSIVMSTSMSVCMSVCRSVRLNISGTTGAIFICGSMADINLRRLRLGEEKKERRNKKPQGKNVMVCPIP